MDVGVVERTVAAVSEQSAHRGYRLRVRIVDLLQRGGDRAEIARDRDDALREEHLVPAPDRIPTGPLTCGPEQVAEKPPPLTEGDGARFGVEDLNCTHRWFLTARFDR